MIRKLLTSTAILSLMSGTAIAETIAVSGGTIWTGIDNEPIANGVVILVDDEIAAIGDDTLAIPGDAILIDADGRWVTPGIFTPFTRVGLVEVGAEASTNDTSASESTYSAALNAADAFNPSATSVPVTRIEGVTRMAVAPGHGNALFAGQGFIADTSGTPNSITEEYTFQYITLGEGGAQRTGGSRTASWTTFQAALDDARSLTARYITNPQGGALNRVDAEALAPAARGQQLILVSVHRASDIRRLIKFADDNPTLDFAVIGATEGWLVADELAAADIPVIIDPLDNLPASFEKLAATQLNAERLITAGVKTAFANLGDNGHQARLVLQAAGNAVANGVSQADAIKAMTSIPADIYGRSDLGRLESGAIADLVIWDGDPLEVTSAPTTVIIAGEIQPLESRQTRLRDRYLDLTDDGGDLPLAYRKGE
jgi:imidazolonepropionase-like amidohydrolase